METSTFGKILRYIFGAVRYIADISITVIGFAGIPDDAKTWKSWLSSAGVDMTGVSISALWPFALIAVSIIWFAYMIWSDFFKKEKSEMTSDDKLYGLGPFKFKIGGDGSVAENNTGNGNQFINSPTINQTHHGSGHNISAETVNIGSQRFELTTDILNDIVARLDKSRSVSLLSMGDGRVTGIIEEIEKHLIDSGFEIGGKMGGGTISGVYFDKPITISPNGFSFPNGMSLMAGAQSIAVDLRDN